MLFPHAAAPVLAWKTPHGAYRAEGPAERAARLVALRPGAQAQRVPAVAESLRRQADLSRTLQAPGRGALHIVEEPRFQHGLFQPALHRRIRHRNRQRPLRRKGRERRGKKKGGPLKSRPCHVSQGTSPLVSEFDRDLKPPRAAIGHHTGDGAERGGAHLRVRHPERWRIGHVKWSAPELEGTSPGVIPKPVPDSSPAPAACKIALTSL